MSDAPLVPYRFMISVRIMHPDIDPAIITQMLKIEPASSMQAGYPRVLRNGKTLSVARESGWLVARPFFADADLSEEDDYGTSVDLSAAVEAFLAPFVDHKEFLRELLVEGRGFVTLAFPGTRFFGGSLRPSVVDLIAGLGFEIGIEIYQVDQNY